MRFGHLVAFLGMVSTVVGCSRHETVVLQPAMHLDAPVAMALPTPVPEIAAKAAAKASAPFATEADLDHFAHVFHVDGRTFVALADAPADTLAAGAPSVLSDRGPMVIRRDVEAKLLPGSIVQEVGRPVRLYGASGAVCEGSLGAVMMIARFEPDPSTRMEWEGQLEDADGNPVPPAPPERVANESWEMAGEDARVLAAELKPRTGDCTNALMARAASAAPLPVVAPSAAPPAVTSAAIEQLRKLDTYQSFADIYREAFPDEANAHWELSAGTPTFAYFTGVHGSAYLWVRAEGGENCSAFHGVLAALWKVEGANTAKPRFTLVFEGASDMAPAAAVDVDGDGTPSLLGVETILRARGGQYETHGLSVPYFGCPC
jgi:hypothetical protein